MLYLGHFPFEPPEVPLGVSAVISVANYVRRRADCNVGLTPGFPSHCPSFGSARLFGRVAYCACST
jgi:hypothetical protein